MANETRSASSKARRRTSATPKRDGLAPTPTPSELGGNCADSASALQHYIACFERAPVAHFLLAADSTILQANLRGARLLGLKRQAQPAQRFDACVDAESHPILHAFLRRTFAGQSDAACELTLAATPELPRRIVQIEAIVDAEGHSCNAIVIDITASKNAESAAQQNLDLLTNLSAHLPGILFQYRLDPDGTTHFPYLSRAIHRMYGVTGQQASEDATRLTSRVHPADAPGLEASMQQSAKSLTPWRHEYRMLLTNGEASWRALEAWPEKLANGSILWHGHTIDISDRKRVEDTLRQNEERWKLALEGAGDGVWDWDVRHDTVTYSARWKEILGYREDEISDRAEEWFSRVHPDDVAITEANGRRLTDGITDQTAIEVRMRAKDGSWKWILSRGIVVSRDEQGRPLRVVGTNSDITDRKCIEERLRENEERWKLALEGAGHGVWDWNLQTGKALFSKRWKEIIGYAEDEIADDANEWISRVHPDDMPRVVESQRAVIAQPQRGSDSIEFRLRCKDGQWRWMLGSGILVSRDANGRPLRMLGTLSDIDQRKQTEEQLRVSLAELEQRRREAEQHSAAKSRLLKAVSHDLRQPLYATHLFAKALADSRLTRKQQSMLENLQLSIKAMSAQLEMLLDVSRLDMGKLQPQMQAIAVSTLCHELEATYAPIAHTAETRLHFLPGRGTVQSDPKLLGRLLGNLIDNAIKFAPRGAVLVCARRCAQGIRIEVRDNGPGIAPEHRQHIFDEYYQVDNPARTPSAGLGLGLSIAQRIAHLLDAPLTLRTGIGRGAVFAVTLPAVAQARRRKTRKG